MARKSNQSQEVQSQVEAEVVNKTVERQKKVQIDPHEMVYCRNVTNGSVYYHSKKNGATYIWADYGDTELLEVGELVSMKASAPRILTEPWLIVEDEEVAKFLGLDKVYENLLSPDQLDDFFTWDASLMEERLKKAPNGTKQLVGERAKQLVADKENDPLTGAQKAVLKRVLNIDLSFV